MKQTKSTTMLSEIESLRTAFNEQNNSDKAKHDQFLYDSTRLEEAYYDVDNIPTEGIVR